MSTVYEPEIAEEPVEVTDNTALAALQSAEIDMQIATAKKWPRSLKAFKQQAMEMATLDEETAASMFYVLPRAGKKIEGPSIRMAEVVGSCYGNLRYGARIVEVGDKFITAQGACHDLEKNIAITYEVRRRITNKKGERFNDDMVQTTGNAAMSIALREAIFRVVPRSLFKNITDEAKLCSVGKSTSMSEKRHKAFDWFKKAGATEKQLLEFLGRAGIDDVTIDDLITLRGLVTSIKDGEATIDDILAAAAEEKAGNGSKVGRSNLNDKIQPGKKPAGKEPEPQHIEDVDQRQPGDDTEEASWDAALATLRETIFSEKSHSKTVDLGAEAKTKFPPEYHERIDKYTREQCAALKAPKQKTL